MRRYNTFNFSFECVVFLSDRDLQTLLQEIDNVTLLHACNKVDAHLLNRITSQYTQNGREYFWSDLSRFGVATEEEIAKARLRVVKLLNHLNSIGRIKDWDVKQSA